MNNVVDRSVKAKAEMLASMARAEEADREIMAKEGITDRLEQDSMIFVFKVIGFLNALVDERTKGLVDEEVRAAAQVLVDFHRTIQERQAVRAMAEKLVEDGSGEKKGTV